jgi:hypothetical protein
MQEISCKMEGERPNVANTLQNDKFKVQTVANTRQIVPAKKSKKESQTCPKKNPKTISHPFFSHRACVPNPTYANGIM